MVPKMTFFDHASLYQISGRKEQILLEAAAQSDNGRVEGKKRMEGKK